MEKAVFAGGCFWCSMPPFQGLPGVISVTAGYTGGHVENPSYDLVLTGTTGHREAIEVAYDMDKVTYDKLLDTFLRTIDPTDSGGQFADRAESYRTAVFYADAAQKETAERVLKELGDSGRFAESIAVEVLPLKNFYPAEDYHQTYTRDNPERFSFYEQASGRAGFIADNWSKAKDDEVLRRKLNREEYQVTQKNATEAPFTGRYQGSKEEGIYVDVASGEALFSSRDKFDPGCGWPSFSRPLEKAAVTEQPDSTLGMQRTEVRSLTSDSHLGHVFEDGPKESGGLRYCINSAALRFIAKDKLAQEGYASYLKLFEK